MGLRSSLKSLGEPLKGLGRNYLLGSPLTQGVGGLRGIWMGGAQGIVGKWEEKRLVVPYEG